jgi:hypothetical protein
MNAEYQKQSLYRGRKGETYPLWGLAQLLAHVNQ